MPSIHILLPVHNRRELTRSFVESLKLQTLSDYHLVLIDDGSTDGTAEMVVAMLPAVTVLRGQGDWWWGGSLYEGRRWLRDLRLDNDSPIVIVNDDVKLEPDFLQQGVHHLIRKPNSFVQSSIYDMKTGELLDHGMHYDDSHLSFSEASNSSPINCLTTNGLFMRWGDFDRAGSLYPVLLPHYLSDYAFTILAGRKGIALTVAEDVKLLWNRETTGMRSFEGQPLMIFLKQLFSKKSAVNPLYWTSFVLLVCNLRYIPINLFRVWRNGVMLIIRHMSSAGRAS